MEIMNNAGLVVESEDVIAAALGFFGEYEQIVKATEEFAELSAELLHYRDGKVSADVVARELADVEIMCAQMRLVLGDALVEQAKEEKLVRLWGVVADYVGEDYEQYGQEGVNTEANQHDVHDSITCPAHYTSHPSGIECIQVTEHMNCCLDNAIKYIWRADLKGNAIEDLKKAKWYIEREITRREGMA